MFISCNTECLYQWSLWWGRKYIVFMVHFRTESSYIPNKLVLPHLIYPYIRKNVWKWQLPTASEGSHQVIIHLLFKGEQEEAMPT